MTRRRLIATGAAVAGFLGSVVAANYVTARYGFIPVGFGQTATAGTFLAGFALAARDAIQDLIGRAGVLFAIAAGAALSFGVSPARLALASAAAFLLSEVADMVVYTPLRRRANKFGDRKWAAAVVVSGTVGAVVDTAAFLTIAFGASGVGDALAGQLVGKLEVTVLFAVVGAVVARVVLREPNRITASS